MGLSSNSSSSNIDELENKEETAQQWIYRHLIEFTNCEDSSAKNLVDGDCSPLIQLLTDMTQSKTLFITITKPLPDNFSNVSVEPVTSSFIESFNIKKHSKKKTKLLPALKNKKKSKSPKRIKKKTTKKKQERDIPTTVEPAIPIVDAFVDMIFEWWNMCDLPPHEQFIFIIPKSSVSNIDSQLDDLYHVGYMRNRRLLKAALSCIDTVFYDKVSFPMKIDLLLLINELEDRKMSNKLVFEKFILENIASNFNLNGRIRNIDSDARSITLILSQTMQSYCFQPDMNERKSNFMTNYSPERKVGPICKCLKKVVRSLVAVSREVFETQEDWHATNKVSFSFYIVGILEEEIDSIIEKVEEMNSETRDMSLDRSAIQATRIILTELDAYLQEKCLESAVESGNLESLRSLAATIVKHNKRLERVVALY